MEPQAEYDRLLAEGERLGAPPYLADLSRRFARDALWKSYDWLLAMLPRGIAGGVAVDIGCKFGHVLPLFLCRGAAGAVGVDVVDEYLEGGRKVLGSLYPGISFAKTEEGLLPLPSDSADLVLVNEVISHVNPMFLENLYGEIGRVLKPGGHVLISDGNNIANEECRKTLLELYEAWENGPAGRRTDRDTVIKPFLDRRREIIGARHPSLDPGKLDYAARNTSGLFGPLLERVVDEYVRTGTLVERSYRRGICPVNPGPGGEVMERGFYPQQVEMALGAYGIRAHQVMPPPPQLSVTGIRGTLRSAAHVLRDRIRRRLDPDAERGASWGFQVLGVKEG